MRVHRGITLSIKQFEDLGINFVRFLPEPNLPPLVVEPSLVAQLGDQLPELPFQTRQRIKVGQAGGADVPNDLLGAVEDK